MPSKLFNHVPDRIFKNNFQPGSSQISIVLVTAEPLASVQQFSGLSGVCTGGTYSHKQLVDIGSISSDRVQPRAGGGIKLVMDSPSWTALSTSDNAPIVGAVLCEGSSVFSSTWLIAYVERVIGSTPTPFTPNGTDALLFDLLTNGFLHAHQ